jgi:BirA family transcriptional regulator, biotin operon repressor / biotin---[acetyl-CoA-carboxylase] ligase
LQQRRFSKGVVVHHFTTIDSTNSEARRRLNAGETPPFWIVADAQTEGRGRLGRHWVSTPGNLYSTYCFGLNAPAHTASQISFVAALAVYDVASNFITNTPITLKWPNDCLIDGAKFSGVLVELQDENIILGMGLNVIHEPTDLPYKATSLAKYAPIIAVENVFATLRLKLKKWLQIWDGSNGFGHIHRGWEARCADIGKPISLDTGQAILHGTFAGLAPNGALLLNHNNTTTTHHAGDVRIIKSETS